MYHLYLIDGGDDYAIVESGERVECEAFRLDYIGKFYDLRKAFEVARIHCPWCFKKRMKRGA